MDIETVTAKLAAFLPDYQDAGQNPASDRITPDTKPLADIKGFDSHFIPEVVRLLARELGEPLPKGTRVRNIFVEKGKKLTVREIAQKFIEKYAREGCKV
jgi:hypothetical protein